jgi:hypothetical protein
LPFGWTTIAKVKRNSQLVENPTDNTYSWYFSSITLADHIIPGFTKIQQVQLDEETVTRSMPNSTLAVIGWFLLAFCMLHFYPLALLGSFCLA